MFRNNIFSLEEKYADQELVDLVSELHKQGILFKRVTNSTATRPVYALCRLACQTWDSLQSSVVRQLLI